MRIILCVLLKWRIYLVILQQLPRKISEPTMCFNLMRTSPSQPHHRLPLNQLIYKISCLNRPPFRNITFLDDGLSSQYLFLYIFPRPARIGPSSHHKFIEYNPKPIIINLKSMVLPAHNLRSHIPRCARGVPRILFPQIFCYA